MPDKYAHCVSERTENGRFAKGCHPGPGLPKGTIGGRKRVIQDLDRFLGEERNHKRLFDELDAWLDDDPRDFWKSLILKLLPRNVTVTGDDFGPALRLAIVDMLEKHSAAGEPSDTEGPSV